MKVQKIKLNGLDFILTSPNEADSPIVTVDSYQKGECSYAHYYSSDGGRISRFGQPIGTAKDIEFGEFIDVEMNEASFLSGLLGDTWSRL